MSDVEHKECDVCGVDGTGDELEGWESIGVDADPDDEHDDDVVDADVCSDCLRAPLLEVIATVRRRLENGEIEVI